MFEDFLNLNYWQTENKLAKIREMINRIGAETLPGTEFILDEMKSIDERLDRIDLTIQNLPSYLRTKREVEEGEEPEELLPDLIVDEIKSETRDHYIDFEITVKNQGKAESGACKLNVAIPSNEDSNVELDVPILGIGDSTILHHQYSFDKDSVEPLETKTLLTTVDSTNVIVESNETNNTRSIQFESLPQPTPPAGSSYIIVHIHNPEGKEIGSIVGSSDISLSHGTIPIDENTHGVPTVLTPGVYNIQVEFNGMSLETGDITIEPDKCYEIFFTFERIKQELIFEVNDEFRHNGGFYLHTPPLTPSDNNLYIDEELKTIIHFENKIWIHLEDEQNETYFLSGLYDVKSILMLTPTNYQRSSFYSLSVSGDIDKGDCRNFYSRSTLPYYYSFSENFESININTINSNDNFDNWYSQSFKTVEYPHLTIVAQNEYTRLLNNRNYGHCTVKIDSNYTYIGVKVLSNTNLSSEKITQAGGSFLPLQSGSAIDETSGSSQFYISSVPYDMEDTAV